MTWVSKGSHQCIAFLVAIKAGAVNELLNAPDHFYHALCFFLVQWPFYTYCNLVVKSKPVLLLNVLATQSVVKVGILMEALHGQNVDDQCEFQF